MQTKLMQIDKIIKNRGDTLNSLYELIKNDKTNPLINSIVSACELENIRENRLSAVTRVVALREDSIVQAMENEGKTKEFIQEAKHKVYEIVKNYHIRIQKKDIDKMCRKNLLIPFYETLIKGVHSLGVILSDLQPFWTKHILENTNEQLFKKFNSTKKIIDFLHEHKLLDTYNGVISDRCYSVLREKEDGSFEVLTYAEAFPNEINHIADILENLVTNLESLEDTWYGQERAYTNYFKALKNAFSQKDKTKLIHSWIDVDRAWMKVTSPFQVGHPLEYYEDHLRKAVALEWDIRFSIPKSTREETIQKSIFHMYKLLYDELEDDKKIYTLCLNNIKRVQLYIGRPAFYYAAEFNGLFSAQVVPNDEIVSKEYGKKIFAYAENILASQKAKPFLKIHKDVFGEKFLKEFRDVIFHKEKLWHKLYATSTIGHEFGHILWLDEDSEQRMNKSGNFKNIEEFKATLGGLVAFFYNEEEELKLPLLRDTIERAVRLIAWMKTGEVEPYYCEGLMHLEGLFESGVLHFKNTLTIDDTQAAYERVKAWYIKTYKKLALHYLKKQDASLFLEQYIIKNNEGIFIPKSPQVRYFVNYYWNLHTSMGRILDEM